MKIKCLKSNRSFSTGLDTGLALFRRQAIVSINVDIVHRRIYTSVGVTESSIMPLYDHDDRKITETDTSSRWLPGLSLGGAKACLQRLRWRLGRSSWRHIRFIDEIAIHSYLLYTVFNTLRPGQDGCLFCRRHFKMHFLEWKLLNSK